MSYSNKCRWSEKMTCDFVSEYVKHDDLYKTSSKFYKNKKMRNDALKKLSASVEIDGFGPRDAAYKIKILRATFALEYRKMKKAEGAYETNLKWFPIMYNALMEANGTADYGESVGPKQNNFEIVSLTPTPTVKQENWMDSENDITNNEINISIENDNSSGESCSYEIQNQKSKVLKRKTIKKKARKRTYAQIQTEGHSSDNVYDGYASARDNEFDIFGKSVAAQLNNMPLRAAVKARLHIQNYLTELRLETLRPDSRDASRSPPIE